jgi:hypothetical protein
MEVEVMPRTSPEDDELREVRQTRDEWADGWPTSGRTALVDIDKLEKGEDVADRMRSGIVVGEHKGHFEARVLFPLDPGAAERPLELLLGLSHVVDQIDARRALLVAECRRRGRSWADIATALGVTRQTAWERYASPDE